MDNTIKILLIGVMIAAITFGVIIAGNIIVGYSLYNLVEQEEIGVRISYDVVSTQGATDNLTGMESVNVHGTFWNSGDEELKYVTVTVIFTDAAHDRVVRKTVVEGVDLLPDGASSATFDAEYLREMTIPKTSVDKTIQVNWIEDGKLKNFITRLDAGMNKAKQ